MARPDWMLGREVKDAKRQVTLNIRQHHIDEAVSQKGDECVAARCALSSLDAAYVWVYRSKAYVAWDDEGPILRYQNSDALIKHVIMVLDDPERSNAEIKPGLYDLMPPPLHQRLGKDRRAKHPGSRKVHTNHAAHRVMGRFLAAKPKAA